MTPRRSIVGTLALTRSGPRRAILIALTLLCLLLAYVPQRYRSAVTLAPGDPAGAAAGPSGANASVLGNQSAVEIAIRVATGVAVRDAVIDRLDLVRRLHLPDRLAAHRWLADAVSVRALRGGIVQIETRQADPVLAEALVSACADATGQRLAIINRQQADARHRALEDLVRQAGARLDRAQAAYDAVAASPRSAAAERLARELGAARALYEGYAPYLQGSAVEDGTSSANLRVIEPPFVDTQRQVDSAFLALALLFVVLGAAIEFYRLRPPVEARGAA